MRAKGVRFGWLGALMVLGLTSVLLSGCRPVEATGRLGETITAGDYQLTATNLANPADPPDRFTNPKVGNRFVKMDVKVANVGEQHLPLAASYFVLRDSGGIDNPAMRGVPTDTGLRETSLPPGKDLSFPMYFEMASNQRPVQLIFEPRVVGWNTRIIVNLSDAVDREFVHDFFEALFAVSLLGITVAVLYRLIVGEVPWTFFIGEIFGLCLGVGLLIGVGPRRHRP